MRHRQAAEEWRRATDGNAGRGSWGTVEGTTCGPTLVANLTTKHKSEKGVLASVQRNAEVLVGEFGRHTAVRRAVQESDLDEEGLVYLFDVFRFFRQRGSQRVHADRAA